MAALVVAWSEPHRHYHDLRHLRECMVLWAEWRDYCPRPAEVAIALWYHDALYFPKLRDNEARSAGWAARDMLAAGIDKAPVLRVHDLVMATCHDSPPASADAKLLVDIDLAILGSPASRFEEYDRDVRLEYDWVPENLYRDKRAQVLESFLARPRIFNTAVAAGRFEAQARANLADAIMRLRLP